MTDLNILLDPLDKALFPGVPPNVQVHDGFRNEHALTAPIILSEVKKLFKSKYTNKVTVVCLYCVLIAVSFNVSVDWTLARRCLGRARRVILDPQPASQQFSESSDIRYATSWKLGIRETY